MADETQSLAQEAKFQSSATKLQALSKDAQKILDMVKDLSVLELAHLVKAMEEEFGVSAAAPVAVAAPIAASSEDGASADASGPSTFNVELTSSGGQKIAVIKIVREITGLGLKEAKDIVDAAPKVVKDNVSKEQAEELKKKLEDAGATVTLK